jgi:hypothetical protein
METVAVSVMRALAWHGNLKIPSLYWDIRAVKPDEYDWLRISTAPFRNVLRLNPIIS